MIAVASDGAGRHLAWWGWVWCVGNYRDGGGGGLGGRGVSSGQCYGAVACSE